MVISREARYYSSKSNKASQTGQGYTVIGALQKRRIRDTGKHGKRHTGEFIPIFLKPLIAGVGHHKKR